MLRIALLALAVAGLGYLGVCGLMFWLQRSLLYFPQPRSLAADASSARLDVPDACLQLTVRPRDGRTALLYFGGNAEDVSASLADLARAFPDHALYLLHYRGFGASTGKPTEAALQADALALFDHAHATHPDVMVIGRSLGSGVAIRLASERPVSRLVLVTPYDSIEELAARRFPYLPVGLMLLDKFQSWRCAPRIRVPTLIAAAEHDAVIPRASTERLRDRFPAGVVSYRVIAGTDHNSIAAAAEYLPLLRGDPGT